MGHIGSISEILSNHGLAGCFWAQDEHCLGENSLLGLGVDRADVTSGVDLSDFSKLLVVLNDWVRLVKVVLHSLLNGLSIVIGPATCLCSLHAPLKHDLLWHLIVENLLGLHYILLKVLSLIDSSWESVD